MHTCIPSCSGGCGRRIARAQEFQVTVRYDHATALHPEQQSKKDAISKRKKKKSSSNRIMVNFPDSVYFNELLSLNLIVQKPLL